MCAFINLGYTVYKRLGPGEVFFVTNNSGCSRVCSGDPSLCKVCSFLWIYTGNPASEPEGVDIASARIRCGVSLAKRDQGIVADSVYGIPDSGIFHGYGYALESGIPILPGTIKYTAAWDRSFGRIIQRQRDEVADFKLLSIRALLFQKVLVITEDSIVRGTQLRNYILKLLNDFNVTMAFLRPACPPLLFPCPFLFSTRRQGELAARTAIHQIEGTVIKDVGAY